MTIDPMISYYRKWLVRERRMLLAQPSYLHDLAHILAAKDQIPADDWHSRLLRVLNRQEAPDTDFVYEVEKYLANPVNERILPTPAPEFKLAAKEFAQIAA